MTPFVPLTATITILLFLSLQSPLCAFVLDTDGNPVFNAGSSYIIIPKGRGGRLTLTQKSGEPPCPNYITRKPTSHGIPVRLSSPLRILHLPTSVRTSLTFQTNLTTCHQPLDWHVTADKTTGKLYVVTGGSPPISTAEYFSIDEAKIDEKKNNNTYKIRFCSSADDGEKCGDVGFFGDGFMGVTNEIPLFARFEKVNGKNEFLEI